jgi:hypothetical protein
MTPAEELRAAAALLREKATEATDGPWEIEYSYAGDRPQALFRMNPDHPDDVDEALGVGVMDEPADNVWVALMSPAMAEPMAAILETCARMAYLWAGTSGRPDAMSSESEAALAFARAITKAAGQ